MPTPTSFFCDTETAARDLFLRQCARAGTSLHTVQSKADGQAERYCDIARLGAPEADTVIVLASGASGTASLVNAGICTGIIAEQLYRELPQRTAMVLVHAPVSEGFVWPAVDALPDAGHAPARSGPPRWDDALLNAADDRYWTGDASALDGDAPPVVLPPPTAWSRRDISGIAKRFLRGFRRAHLIDFRTWQGPWAEPTVRTAAATDGLSLTRASLAGGSRTTQTMPGRQGEPEGAGLSVYTGPTETTLSVVEFGTFPGSVPFGAMTRREALPNRYPEDPGWRRQAWAHAKRFILQALEPSVSADKHRGR